MRVCLFVSELAVPAALGVGPQLDQSARMSVLDWTILIMTDDDEDECILERKRKTLNVE